MTGATDIVRHDDGFLLYQTEDGATRVEVRFIGETAWLSLKQMADLFQRDKSVISRHIKSVFDEAVREVKLLDKQRPTDSKPKSKTGKGAQSPRKKKR